MSNTINVTACDNELIILAYQWGASFELCRVLSGNSNSVNVNLTLGAGSYTGSVVLNGVNNPLNQSLSLYLPSGEYTLLLMGIDWGGPEQFTVSVNNQNYSLPYGSSGDGLVWNPGPIAITV
jgi:hypothetical protein